MKKLMPYLEMTLLLAGVIIFSAIIYLAVEN